MIIDGVLLLLLVLAGVAGVTGFGVHDSRHPAYSLRDLGRVTDPEDTRG
jgi:hypothetical protein